MKCRQLSEYNRSIKSCLDAQNYQKALHLSRIVVRNIDKMEYSHDDEYRLYELIGASYARFAEYTASLDSFHKAKIIALRHSLPQPASAYASFMLGGSFLLLKNIDQALAETLTAASYYRHHCGPESPKERFNCVGTLIQLAYCRLYRKEFSDARVLLEQEIPPFKDVLKYALIRIDYNHLLGEYYIETSEYVKARNAFNKCIDTSREINFPPPAVQAKLHLASIELLEGNIGNAIKILQSSIKEARRLKFAEPFCESALLLSKCFSLAEQYEKAARIEARIKQTLKKLDIVWLYEKDREFEQLFRRIQLQTTGPAKTVDYAPKVLTDTLNKHYNSTPYKEMIAGSSAVMLKVYNTLEKIAPSDLPVLIQGETGTGKELIAHAMHDNSRRKGREWLAFNCAAVPESLMENELFGHEKGAFTGAAGKKKGYIEIALNGTLFLDEIADMSPAMQSKLLRVIEEKQVWRIGSEKPVPVNTRFVLASNKNLEELVRNKSFREDLFYRINTFVINLPPLRKRAEDIPALAAHFIRKYSAETNAYPDISEKAMQSFVRYNWPGNIRELENEIKRICVLHKGTRIIDEPMLSDSIQNSRLACIDARKGSTMKQLREEFEKNVIIETIRRHNGNVSSAARELGYARQSLHEKMNSLNIRKI